MLTLKKIITRIEGKRDQKSHSFPSKVRWLSLPLQLRTFKVMRNETNSSVCARLCSYIYASWHVNTSDIINFLPRHNLSEASRLNQIQIKLSPPPKWSSAWKSKHWVSRFPELRTGRLWSSAFTQSKRKNRANNLSEIRQWLLMRLGKQARKVMRIFKFVCKAPDRWSYVNEVNRITGCLVELEAGEER